MVVNKRKNFDHKKIVNILRVFNGEKVFPGVVVNFLYVADKTVILEVVEDKVGEKISLTDDSITS